MKSFRTRFFAARSGSAAVEYALIAALIATALIAGIKIVSPALSATFQSAAQALPTD